MCRELLALLDTTSLDTQKMHCGLHVARFQRVLRSWSTIWRNFWLLANWLLITCHSLHVSELTNEEVSGLHLAYGSLFVLICSVPLGEQSTNGTGTYNYKGPNSANLPHVLVSSKWQSCVLSGVSPLIIPWPLAATHTQLCSSWWLLFWWGLKGSGGRPRVKTDLEELLWDLNMGICFDV